MHKVGDRIILTRTQSVQHFLPYMPITGVIVEWDPAHVEGYSNRPYLIQFDDDRLAWYAGWEFKKVK